MAQTERAVESLIMKEADAGVALVWDKVDDFTRIPRKTGEEQGMIAYMKEWANEKGFSHEVDKMGNVLVLVPATEGYENAPGVIVQGHMDMVCVGEPDPAVHGVKPVIVEDEDGAWLTADGTSVGLDNALGLGVGLALAEDKIAHGPMAIMATVNEEVGLIGAMGMDFQTPLDDYKYLLNFDSEEEGEATISCAGGGDSIVSLPVEREVIGEQQLLTIDLKGLMGGHSGIEIGEGRINGIKAMSKVLNKLTGGLGDIQLVSLEAGVARNVIPFEVQAVIAVDADKVARLPGLIGEVRESILANSQHDKEQALKISYSTPETEVSEAMTVESSKKVMELLAELPDGVLAMSQSVEGLVETSTNLATLNTEGNILKVELMTRSSVDADIAKTRESIRATSEKFGASVELTEPYPGWPANPDSYVNQIAKDEWQKLSGEELKIIAIHAGLECGAIMGKYPHLEAISIGPEIEGAHSTEERALIESVGTFYQFARNMVQAIANL